MTWLDRFGWWIAKPANCSKVAAVYVGILLSFMLIAGDWGMIP